MAMRTDAQPRRPSMPLWLTLLVLPPAGLALLLARPELDLEWEHHPSHFWLVLGVALVSVALGYLTNEAAARRGDARLLLISLAFLVSSGFLGLHALATPQVLLPSPNLGFVIATPVGLTLASGFAAASVLPLGGPRGALVLRHARALRASVLGLIAAWAAVSVLQLPPLDSPMPGTEVAPPLRALAVVAVALYAFAAWRVARLYQVRQRPLLVAVLVAFVLLAEAMMAVVFSRDWRLSWWEWHVLMALAFGAIALGARIEYRREGSLTGAFGGLYLSSTLERLDRWHARALTDLAAAEAGHEPVVRVLDRLRRDGATTEELALLERATHELRRVDELFGPYLPEQVAAQIRREPERAGLGGEEREVSVLFADLSGFTAFSERREPMEVVELLNTVWGALVPIVEREGGLIESFAGDGLMAVFNAVVEQPDHPIDAARAALAIRDEVDALRAGREGWPRLHIGINTGPAFVGVIGAAGRRSFSAIGDTTNLASRLMDAAFAGEIVIGEATWSRVAGRQGAPFGPLSVKGKQAPIQAWKLDGLGAPAPRPQSRTPSATG